VIKAGEIRANFLSIAWPYVALVGVLCIRHLVRAPHHLDAERQGDIEGLGGQLATANEEIRRLTTKPDIGGDILRVFWAFASEDHWPAHWFGNHSRYYVELRLVNYNSVPCTIDRYIITVRDGDGRIVEGEGRLTLVTICRPIVSYERPGEDPKTHQTTTHPLNISSEWPLERARSKEGWVQFDVRNYVPSIIKEDDVNPHKWLAPWQQDITITAMDSLGGSHQIRNVCADVGACERVRD